MTHFVGVCDDPPGRDRRSAYVTLENAGTIQKTESIKLMMYKLYKSNLFPGMYGDLVLVPFRVFV
jgi:hypothetical protein